MIEIGRRLITAAVFAMLATRLATAQDCSLSPNFCTRLNPDMIVFIGQESSKEDATSRDPLATIFWSDTLVTFDVKEVLWGFDKLQKTIPIHFLGGYESSREPRFLAATPGSKSDYIVDYCGGGLNLAVDDPWALKFREHLKDVTLADVPVRVVVSKGYLPLPDARVQLKGSGRIFAGITDSSGQLQFSSVPPGTYSLTTKAATDSFSQGSRRVSILPGSCSELVIPLQPLSRLSGQIVDASGNPVRNLRGFDLIGWADNQDAQDYRRSHVLETDSEGRFSVEGVMPGKYYLGANIWVTREPRQAPYPRTYYPGVADRAKAELLLIEPGQALEGILFRLPDYGKTRRLTVRVMSADGLPVAHAVVEDGPAEIEEVHVTSIGPRQFTNDQGVATFDVWQASEYHIDARLVLPKMFYQSRTVPVPAGISDSEIVIILEMLRQSQITK